MPSQGTIKDRIDNLFRQRIVDILRREANNRPDTDPRNLRKDRTNDKVYDKVTGEGRTADDRPLTKWERRIVKDIINEERLRRNDISKYERQERTGPTKHKPTPQESYDIEVIVVRIDPVTGKEHRERRWIEDQHDTSDKALRERIEADQMNEDQPYTGGQSALPSWLDIGTAKIKSIITLDIVLR